MSEWLLNSNNFNYEIKVSKNFCYYYAITTNIETVVAFIANMSGDAVKFKI